MSSSFPPTPCHFVPKSRNCFMDSGDGENLLKCSMYLGAPARDAFFSRARSQRMAGAGADRGSGSPRPAQLSQSGRPSPAQLRGSAAFLPPLVPAAHSERRPISAARCPDVANGGAQTTLGEPIAARLGTWLSSGPAPLTPCLPRALCCFPAIARRTRPPTSSLRPFFFGPNPVNPSLPRTPLFLLLHAFFLPLLIAFSLMI